MKSSSPKTPVTKWQCWLSPRAVEPSPRAVTHSAVPLQWLTGPIFGEVDRKFSLGDYISQELSKTCTLLKSKWG